MRAEGFTYFPPDIETAAPVNARPSTRADVESSGFGISLNRPPAGSAPVVQNGFSDADLYIINELDQNGRSAYWLALRGGPVESALHPLDLANDGCQGQAKAAFDIEFTVGDLITFNQDQRAPDTTDEWIRCMNAAGYTVGSAGELRSEILERLEVLGPGDVNELAALGEYERTAALHSFDCEL